MQPASSNSRNTPIVEPKIKIKKKSKQKLSPIKSQDQANLKESSSGSHSQPILKKKGEFKDEESNQDVLDMIEKVQSNGFDDQRYKQPCSIPTGSSVSFVDLKINSFGILVFEIIFKVIDYFLEIGIITLY